MFLSFMDLKLRYADSFECSEHQFILGRTECVNIGFPFFFFFFITNFDFLEQWSTLSIGY